MSSISFSGLASGIDTDALIKASADSSRLALVPLETKIDANAKETSALEEFNTKLLALSDQLTKFMTLSGGAISKSATSSDSDSVSVVAGTNAKIGTMSVTVSQLARSGVFSFNDRFTEADTPLTAASGSVTITVGSGASQKTISADVDATTTLSGLAEKLNSAAGDHVSVSVVNAGTEDAPSYMLLVSGTQTGAVKGELQVTADDSLIAAGLFASGLLEQARDAVFSVSGIGEVTRSSNQVSDLLPGVSLSFNRAGGAPVSVSIANNAKDTAEQFGNLLNAFNELVGFQKENSTITRAEADGKVTNIYGDLAHIRLDDQAVQAIKTAIAEGSVSVDDGVLTAAELGLSTERDGTYKFDSEKFESTLAKNPSAASSLLQAIADKLGGAGGAISEYTRYNGQIDTAITANKAEVESMNVRIDRVEQSIVARSESLKKLYAAFEANMGKLTSNSNALTALLASLSNN